MGFSVVETRKGIKGVHNLGEIVSFKVQIGTLRDELAGEIGGWGQGRVSRYVGIWVEPWMAKLVH